MDEDFLNLTNTAYKLLEYFPEDLVKVKAKEKVLSVMESLALASSDDLEKEKIRNKLSEDIEILLGYFKIGKTQGWLSSINYLIVLNEYQKIIRQNKVIGRSDLPIVRSDLTKTETETEEVEVMQKESYSFVKLSDRQQKIIKFLEDKEKAQVMDLQAVLPTVTKRTIRRDLDELLMTGKIVRLGEFNQVFYKVAY